MTRRTHWNKGLLVFLLLLGDAPTATARTIVSEFRLKGVAATALFVAFDPNDGCLFNLVDVVSADLIEKVLQNGRTQVLRTTVQVIQFDTCTDFFLVDGFGETDIHTLEVAADLSSAQLTATVEVFDDFLESFVTFQLNLTWNATSKASTGNFVESFKDKELGINIKNHIRSTMAEAVATGTVIGLGYNFSPEPSDSGTIQRGSDSVHIVQRGF